MHSQVTLLTQGNIHRAIRYQASASARRSIRLARLAVLASESPVGGIGPDSAVYGTHTMRRRKASLSYGSTKNLRAVQLLWTPELEGMVRTQRQLPASCDEYRSNAERPTHNPIWTSFQDQDEFELIANGYARSCISDRRALIAGASWVRDPVAAGCRAGMRANAITVVHVRFTAVDDARLGFSSALPLRSDGNYDTGNSTRPQEDRTSDVWNSTQCCFSCRSQTFNYATLRSGCPESV